MVLRENEEENMEGDADENQRSCSYSYFICSRPRASNDHCTKTSLIFNGLPSNETVG